MLSKSRLLYLIIGISLHVSSGYAQNSFTDTVKITVCQADSLFLTKNLTLLSERYNVDAARALIIQSRLWDNPNVTVNQNVINSEYKTNGGRKWFDWTGKGETSAQVQQLFVLAGKRNKRINMAELAATREEQNYFDMLRTLKYSLRSGFYNIYYLQRVLRVYNREIVSLSKIILVFENQMEKGFASKKDVLRLKAGLFSLESEETGFHTQLIADLSDFNVLMHTSGIYYLPKPDTAALSRMSTDSLKLQPLIDTAFVCRYDLKMAQSDLSLTQVNLAYQKAMAVPDLTVIAGWDRNGSFVHNYNFVGLQMDLPFFNRNQGNIKSARFNVESSKLKFQSAEEEVRSDVTQAYATLEETNRLYLKFDNKFVNDLETLNQEMIKNYEKRNISLLEFLDFYDAYKENMIQLNTLQNNRINAFENLNFSVGKEIVK
jgi:cobalt-zinc-cadmium efflux system outer membrane protein